MNHVTGDSSPSARARCAQYLSPSTISDSAASSAADRGAASSEVPNAGNTTQPSSGVLTAVAMRGAGITPWLLNAADASAACNGEIYKPSVSVGKSGSATGIRKAGER